MNSKKDSSFLELDKSMLKFIWNSDHERTAKETLKKALGGAPPPPRTPVSGGGVLHADRRTGRTDPKFRSRPERCGHLVRDERHISNHWGQELVWVQLDSHLEKDKI